MHAAPSLAAAAVVDAASIAAARRSDAGWLRNGLSQTGHCCRPPFAPALRHRTAWTPRRSQHTSQVECRCTGARPVADAPTGRTSSAGRITLDPASLAPVVSVNADPTDGESRDRCRNALCDAASIARSTFSGVAHASRLRSAGRNSAALAGGETSRFVLVCSTRSSSPLSRASDFCAQAPLARRTCAHNAANDSDRHAHGRAACAFSS